MSVKSCCVYSTGVLSILILIAGIVMVLLQVFQNVLYAKIKEEIVLRNGTQAFNVWENPPAPVYMQFYFFNVTNPSEILKGERPAVIEVGPYTYREFRPMERVNFLENGTKVSAVNVKTYVFQPNMSKGLQDDLIRTVNIPAMTVMEDFKDMPLIANFISAYMKSVNENLMTTHTVGELLWGYEDGLLKALKKFQPTLNDVFGLFYKQNASDDGEYVFLTGQQDYQDFAVIDQWKGQSVLNWWTTDECNMINGTNGASFHPIITKNETLYMFNSDLCRSIYTTFEEERNVKGVPGYRFSPPSSVFANTTENAGFCSPPGNCLGSGVLNVSACKQGAPIVMSSPHFYQADEKFVKDIFGMKPNKEQHETIIDINPLTGMILQASKRLQVNVFVEKIPVFSQTGDIRSLVFPVLYLNESVVIDDWSAKQLGVIVEEGNIIVNIPFILIALGILLGLVFMVLQCRQRIPEGDNNTPRQGKQREHIYWVE
uniref:Scavenger receptor class B, member 2c n=1 Tax=Esox lucius TaxID=8010 RepID=A0AAY5K9H8_ESOLU